MVTTLGCLCLFWNNGLSSFTVLFWLKIGILGLTYYFINDFKQKEYYYYLNLGVSKRLLWTTTLTFDLGLFLFLIILTYQFR